MTDRFLSTSGDGSTNLSNGSIKLFVATLSANNLDPSKAVKTNSIRQLVSTNLDISDINGLQSSIEAIIKTPYIGTISATNFDTSVLSDSGKITTSYVADNTDTSKIILSDTTINLLAANVLIKGLVVPTNLDVQNNTANISINTTNITNLDNNKLNRSGTQSMTGNLNMGTFSITNVNLVDNVKVATLNNTVLSNTTNIASNTTNISNLDTNKLNRSGNQTMLGDLNMGTFSLTNVNLVDGVKVSTLNNTVTTNTLNIATNTSKIALNTTNITNLDTNKLNRSGTQSMTGALNMGGFKISNMSDPLVLLDAVNKNYVDLSSLNLQNKIVDLQLKTQNISSLNTNNTQTVMMQDLRIQGVGANITAYATNNGSAANPNSGNFGFRFTPSVDIIMTLFKYSTSLYSVSRAMTLWRVSDSANLNQYTFTGAESIVSGYYISPVINIPLSAGQIYIISANNSGGSINLDVNTNSFNSILTNVVGRTITGSNAITMPLFDQALNVPYVPNFEFATTSSFLKKDIYAKTAFIENITPASFLTISGKALIGVRPIVSSSYTMITPITISSSAVETIAITDGIGSLVIPANTMGLGSTSKSLIAGSLNAVSSATITLNLKIIDTLNSSSAITLLHTFPTNSSSFSAFTIDTFYTVISIVGNNTAIAYTSVFQYRNQNGAMVGESQSGNLVVNSTLNLTSTFTVKWGLANAGNIWTTKQANNINTYQV